MFLSIRPRWLYMVMLFLLQLTQLSSQLSTKYLQSKISKSAIYSTKIATFKVRLHSAINLADFVSWCILYTKEGNKCICEKMTLCFRV